MALRASTQGENHRKIRRNALDFLVTIAQTLFVWVPNRPQGSGPSVALGPVRNPTLILLAAPSASRKFLSNPATERRSWHGSCAGDAKRLTLILHAAPSAGQHFPRLASIFISHRFLTNVAC